MENPEIKNNPEFSEFKVGDEIEWIDKDTREKFNAPAFGYGTQFKILDIKHRGAYLAILIDTPKGKKELSSDHFKVVSR